MSQSKVVAWLACVASAATLCVVRAEPLVIQGDALREYLAAGKGRTFTIADGERITFFADGTFVDCSPKGSCDQGTYTVEQSRVLRKYDKWTLNGSPIMPITFKKDGADEFFNVRKISSRTEAVVAEITEYQSDSPKSDEIAAPHYKAGNTWTWTAKVSPRGQCDQGTSTGMKQSLLIADVTDQGYLVKYQGASNFSRVVRRDLSFDVTAEGKTYRTDVLNFPISPGKKWDTHLRGGSVLTALSCEVEKFERVTLGKRQVTVAPIVCNGAWFHLQSKEGAGATYKYWYAPEVGNFVKWSISTTHYGRPCILLDYDLDPRE